MSDLLLSNREKVVSSHLTVSSPRKIDSNTNFFSKYIADYTHFNSFWLLKHSERSPSSKYSLKTQKCSFQKESGSNRISFYTPSKGMKHCFNISNFNKDKFMHSFENDKAVWLDILNPSSSELDIVANTFKIHPLIIEDISYQETREKYQTFSNYCFINYKCIEDNNKSVDFLAPVNVYMLLCNSNVLLTFHYGQSINRYVESVYNRLQLIENKEGIDAFLIKYSILDDITDSFTPVLNVVETEVDSIDDLVLLLKESEQSDMLRRMGHARKKVTALLRMLNSKTDVIKGIISKIERTPSKECIKDLKLYYNDILDHIITMLQNSFYYEKELSRAYSNYLAQISIELTQSSNKTNDVVAKLTVLASIFLPMNIITGLFGMNVTVPGQYNPSLTWFLSIVGFMFCIATVIIVFVKKSGML